MTASPSIDAVGATAQRVEPRARMRSRPRLRSTVPRSAFALRDDRRTRNRDGGELRELLRCECARPDCRATVPARVDVHRRRPEQFIVIPDHLAGESVVAAADRFFVVELQMRDLAHA